MFLSRQMHSIFYRALPAVNYSHSGEKEQTLQWYFCVFFLRVFMVDIGSGPWDGITHTAGC